MTNPNIPSTNVKIVDEKTLTISREWYIFLLSLANNYTELKKQFDEYVSTHP